MISVEEALARIFALVEPLPTEPVPLRQAAGRVLAAPVIAPRDQPPFSASAMDGYAVRGPVAPGQQFTVIGESAAGRASGLSVGPGEAVRIFTGAPLPEGADRIVIQEDVERSDNTITLRENLDDGTHIRPAGGDFKAGDRLEPGRRLSPNALALAAAMGAPTVTCTRKPVVALIATGDELVMPGEAPGPDQIIASNSFALAALFEAEGAECRLLPIARDNRESLSMAFTLARGADLVVTTGGASVGDHDLVGEVAAELGMDRAFYKVAMRPGKPLMAGRVLGMAMVGLPGNPVSSIVCGHVFIRPAIRKMLGLGEAHAPRRHLPLAEPITANGPRAHYMRATVSEGAVTVFDRQDSSLLSVLDAANALVVRPVSDGARAAGEMIEVIDL
ncbi:gephyrin-like molybdotransferase Glp [Vannielia litorea]|uniref:molybdopterin molybdotransferase MoeA n=1 Tax=Vannielia litorea TaxID=1217970 RepID=UPI001C94669B|nr:gephyrin-like molybdotransferase Glp [Vannielia litorea]MBY6047746.1 molybdopterin molybdotransferase MoeA [Vannielia litorea]MBY6075160.1 molybdopterin molybdotransferase MoeA [Vannielia litorea]